MRDEEQKTKKSKKKGGKIKTVGDVAKTIIYVAKAGLVVISLVVAAIAFGNKFGDKKK